MLASFRTHHFTYLLAYAVFCRECLEAMSGVEIQNASYHIDGIQNNHTLILCAATQNTSWTEAVTENHILWVQRISSADYRYVEDPRFGFEEIHWNSSNYPIGSYASQSSKSIPGESRKRLQPHWLKIHLLQEFMAQETNAGTASYSHILWVDDDILFTSRVDLLKSLYEHMDRDTHLIIAKDVGHIVTTTTTTTMDNLDHRIQHAWNQVNTGFMFFRISQNSRTLLELVWEQRLSHLGFCENQTCLHEQEALNNVLDPQREIFDEHMRKESRVDKTGSATAAQYMTSTQQEHISSELNFVQKMVKVLEPYNPIEPMLNLNTVWRLTHMWKGELQPKNYRGDPLHRRWHWGDNMAHVSGMTRSCRKEMLLWLAKHVKEWIFLEGEKSEYPLDSDVVVFTNDFVRSPSWHPLALTQCGREAAPTGGGNWVLPRRTTFDLDAVLVAHIQGSLENSVDLTRLSTISLIDQHDFQHLGAGINSGAIYLWQLLLLSAKRLPYLDNHLLLQLTDSTGMGMERYWNLVLYSIQVSSKNFADVDPEVVNHLSTYSVQNKMCGAQSHPSDDGSMTPLQSRRSIGKRSLFGLTISSCSPYALLSLAAIAQNPDVFTWVSPSGLSFVEYHTIALEAVLRRPEQLANVDPMIYLDLAEGSTGGLAYYDLAMKAVSLEGIALQHLQKVSIAYDDLYERHGGQGFQDVAPLLLPPPSWAKGSFPLVIAPGRRNQKQHKNDGQSENEASHIWPWDIVDISGKIKHSDKRRSYFSLARAAVHQDGFALQFVSVEELRYPAEEYLILAKIAVAQNGRAFAIVDASAIGGAMSESYYEIALKAVHSIGEAFWEIDTAFLSDIELIVLVLKAIHNGDPAAFKAFNTREALKQRKGTYTELALLALSGAGAESFRGAALKDITKVMGMRPRKTSTVDVLEFIDSGRLVGAKARYAMADAVLQQGSNEEVWERVDELFRQGMRKDDYQDLVERYGVQ